MPRQSVVDSPPPMPDLRASHVAEGQPPRQAPPALPTEAPAGSRRREAARRGDGAASKKGGEMTSWNGSRAGIGVLTFLRKFLCLRT